MRQYETTFIVAPVLSDGEIKKAAESYEKLLKKEGCEIVHVDNIGLRQLAYPIKKHNSGVYYTIEYTVETGEVIDKLELAFRRDERILRFLTVKLDKYGIQYNADKRAGIISKRRDELAAARAKEREELEASNKAKKAENRKKQADKKAAIIAEAEAKAAEAKATVEVPAEKTATVEVPAEKTATVEVPAEVKPTVEVPAEKTATVEVPAEVKPTVEVPAEKTATVEVPAEVKPTVEVPAEKTAPVETVDAAIDVAEEVSLDMDILDDLTDSTNN